MNRHYFWKQPVQYLDSFNGYNIFLKTELKLMALNSYVISYNSLGAVQMNFILFAEPVPTLNPPDIDSILSKYFPSQNIVLPFKKIIV